MKVTGVGDEVLGVFVNDGNLILGRLKSKVPITMAMIEQNNTQRRE